MNKPISAKELSEFLNNVVRLEGKDFQVYIGNRPMYRDDISLDVLEKKVDIRGMLYHEDIWKKTEKLKDDINEAFRRFME